MAYYWLYPNDTNITIDRVEETDGISYYVIRVNVKQVSWYVKHRYNDFYELHQQLVSDHSVSKDLLPPKRVLNNKCPIFIENRRTALEAYLKSVFNYLQRTMPRLFVHFLHFHYYDIFFLLRNIAFQVHTQVDIINSYTFNVLELHAISKCFQQPQPSLEESDSRYDLSHILNVCSQLHQLRIKGIDEHYKNSNIVPNQLAFELSHFKCLHSLQVIDMSLVSIYALGSLRNTLKTFKLTNHPIINQQSTNILAEIFACDVVHKSVPTENEIWHGLHEIDLSDNHIENIESDMLKLIPNVRTLNLSRNELGEKMCDMSALVHLRQLVMSNNRISRCEDMHLLLGNIVHLDLSQNRVRSLHGFCKLYSLESLDLRCNQIADIDQVRYLGMLPCLEQLILTGNTVAVAVDYRVLVLEHFNTRAADIYLDSEKPTQKEIDTIYILQALRFVKEGKTPPTFM